MGPQGAEEKARQDLANDINPADERRNANLPDRLFEAVARHWLGKLAKKVRLGKRSVKTLEKATWAGAVDPVGGATLAWLTRTMMQNGCIASSGLTGGTELHTTVLPFILRGVKLLGIDSVMCPMPTRLEVWRRLATDLKPAKLVEAAHEIGFDDLPSAFDTLLKGQARGRHVVRCQ